MKTNPFYDTWLFLLGRTGDHGNAGVFFSWVLTLGFLALIAASIWIARENWREDPAQRTPEHLATWGMRFFIGAMWFQGSLWKLPLPVSGGFGYWLGLMGDNAAFGFYGSLIKSVLVANIAFVNPMIFLVEVTLAASLMLGIAVRLTALLGVAMALNLWIGLYHFQPEWPWIYIFIVMLHVFLIADRAGRALGLDAMLLRVKRHWFQSHPWLMLAG